MGPFPRVAAYAVEGALLCPECARADVKAGMTEDVYTPLLETEHEFDYPQFCDACNDKLEFVHVGRECETCGEWTDHDLLSGCNLCPACLFEAEQDAGARLEAAALKHSTCMNRDTASTVFSEALNYAQSEGYRKLEDFDALDLLKEAYRKMIGRKPEVAGLLARAIVRDDMLDSLERLMEYHRGEDD